MSTTNFIAKREVHQLISCKDKRIIKQSATILSCVNLEIELVAKLYGYHTVLLLIN